MLAKRPASMVTNFLIHCVPRLLLAHITPLLLPSALPICSFESDLPLLIPPRRQSPHSDRARKMEPLNNLPARHRLHRGPRLHRCQTREHHHGISPGVLGTPLRLSTVILTPNLSPIAQHQSDVHLHILLTLPSTSQGIRCIPDPICHDLHLPRRAH